MCALIGLAAPGAQASDSVRFGIQDDSWLTHGAGTLDDRLDRLESLGVDIVRFNLHWDRIEPVRGEQNWDESDLVLNGLHDRGIPAIVGARWLTALGERRQDSQLRAGGGHVRRVLANGRDPLQLGQPVARVERAEPGAVASPDNTGRVRPPAPEPRLQGDPRRESERQGGWRRHRPARLDRGRLARELDPRHAKGAAPSWMRTRTIPIRRTVARARSPTAAASTARRSRWPTLERLLSEVKRAFGPKRIWLTEYGYQTGAYGVTQQRQAELIGQAGMRVQKAPRVDMLIHYLVKDEPEASRFQSGLFQNSGRPKLAALAFPFPIAQAGRSGGNLVLWGQIRPRSGAQTYRVQIRTTGAWRFSGGVRKTSARGFFSTAVQPGLALACGSTRRRTRRTASRSARAERSSRSSIGPGMKAKGLIAAGGEATRLGELTRVVNKHLLPVGAWPMIFYPLQLLELAGVHEVMIVTGQGHAGQLIDLLGNGR